MRPTAEELLYSSCVPLAKVESNELQEMLRHVLNNPQSRIYKHLIARCLAQESDIICELTYHMDMMTIAPLFEVVKSKIKKMFARHGAIEVLTPLLTPFTKNNLYEKAVKLMTHSGSIVTLPHDLRTPFIRYVALNGIKCLRRYSIERVYREKRVFNFHPKQNYECAFDIITPGGRGNLLIDAELIFMAYNIVNEFPALKKKNVSFRLNHTNILKAILLYCNVPQEKYKGVLLLIRDFLENKISKFQLTSSISSMVISAKNNISTLIELVQVDTITTNVNSSALRKLIRGRGEPTQLAKGALKELENVITLAQHFGVVVSIKKKDF